MKKCDHCNAENLDNARYCDSCGIKLGEIILEESTVEVLEETFEATEEIKVEVLNEEQPNEPVSTYDNGYYMSNTPQRRQTGLMAFSIINICSIVFSVFTLYMTFFTMIFGIIATVTLSKAKDEPNDEFYKIKKKNALILNIVGLVLGLIGFIGFIGFVIYLIVSAIQGVNPIL